MNLLITLEHRFDRTPDGAVWTQTGFSHAFWQRYLAVFDHVRVLARVREVHTVPPDCRRADGEGVSFVPVPCYVGPWQYLRRWRAVRAAVRGALRIDEAVIMRIGSNLAAILAPALRRSGHPYGVEVVSDPYDTFAPGAVRHPLRPLFRWLFTRRQRRLCVHACAAAYVTEKALQRRYPPAPHAFSTHYSSIELPPEAIVPEPRRWAQPPDPARLVLVGSLAQMYKAPDVLLQAVARCCAQGLPVTLTILGDGKHRPELEALASTLGLSDGVHFLGQVPAGAAVRQQLDRADLFVMPSRQEGLPRAMIEAMARGLPCIGSTVGGIPELLPPEDLVPPGDAIALADRIAAVLRDPARMTAMSQRNLAKGREYADAVLHERRVAFYEQVRRRTEAWLNQIR